MVTSEPCSIMNNSSSFNMILTRQLTVNKLSWLAMKEKVLDVTSSVVWVMETPFCPWRNSTSELSLCQEYCSRRLLRFNASRLVTEQFNKTWLNGETSSAVILDGLTSTNIDGTAVRWKSSLEIRRQNSKLRNSLLENTTQIHINEYFLEPLIKVVPCIHRVCARKTDLVPS